MNAAVGTLLKGGAVEAHGGLGSASLAWLGQVGGLLRVASLLLGVAALALFWLAFTQFDGGGGPPPGSPDRDAYERDLMQDARLSVALGLAGCVVLLGAFACHERATGQRGGS